MTTTTHPPQDMPSWFGAMNHDEAIDAVDTGCEQIYRIVQATAGHIPLEQERDLRLTAARFLCITARQIMEGSMPDPSGAAHVIKHIASVQEQLWQREDVTTLVRDPATGQFIEEVA